MAISNVKIANMALSHIGAGSIESLTEDSAEAEACDLWFDYSRKQALEASDWTFARRRLTLAVDADDPPSEYSYRYQYPSDCVNIRHLVNPAGRKAYPVPYKLELVSDGVTHRQTILTDLQDAVAVYTMDIDSPDIYTPFFIDMLSLALAAKIAFTVTGKKKIQDDMAARFREMAAVAPSVNANEEVPEEPDDADWIKERIS